MSIRRLEYLIAGVLFLATGLFGTFTDRTQSLFVFYVLGLAFVVIMVIGDAGNPGMFGPIGHGGAERMIVYPAMLWLMAFGGYLMASPSGDAGD